MNGSFLGAFIGLLTMVGMLTVIGRLRATAPPSLATRVAVHMGTARRAERDAGPFSAYLALLRPRVLRSSEAALRRLDAAGRQGGVYRLRIDQLVWGGGGLGVGTLFGWWAITTGATPVAIVLLPSIGAVVGVLVLDRRISAQARRRRARIEGQLPDVAELLAFAVAAGEPILPALHRVSAMIAGDLGDEITRVVADASTGIPMEDALRSASDRMGVASVERFVDGLIISLERGTPLVSVVRAQASDARAVQQQALMEQAGRKDVIMLVPVVFLILPTVVVIALFPGLRGLQALTS